LLYYIFVFARFRFFASEIIRAALFRKLGKELPYCCDVRIEEFKEPKEGQKDPIIRIRATIYVERDSQKGIVVGKGGLMVKDLGSDARVQLKDFFQSKVRAI
jgi:GTP-binding protein Era